jgi:sialic acid synthase SpsE
MEIIAEIAQGFEGNDKLAKLLVKGGVAAEADSIKLQLVFADELCIPNYHYYDFFSSLEMTVKTWEEIAFIVHKANKNLYFDIYGNKSFEMAKKLKADGVKISSTDFYNFELIQKSIEYFNKVFISIGGIQVDSVDNLLKKIPNFDKIVLMFGFQSEPTLIEDNNLARIKLLMSRFPNIKIGFMDHSDGSLTEAYDLSVMALGAGINIIEKHITLDRSLQIEDYISALSIDNFKLFVKKIKFIYQAYGSASLSLTDKEIIYGKKAAKNLVANKNLFLGHKVTKDDVAFKRVTTVPNSNYFHEIDNLIGLELLEDIKENQVFKRTMTKKIK